MVKIGWRLWSGSCVNVRVRKKQCVVSRFENSRRRGVWEIDKGFEIGQESKNGEVRFKVFGCDWI